MKKYFFFTFIFLLPAFVSFSQTDSIIHWSVSAKKISDSIYELKATATVPAGWHLYGANPNVDGLGAETIQFNYDYENAQNTEPVKFSGKEDQISDSIFNKKVTVYKNDVEVTQRVNIHGVIPAELKGTITAYLGRKDEFQTPEFPFDAKLEGGVVASSTATQLKLSAVDVNHPVNDCGVATSSSSSLLSVFLLGFLGGLIALLTPCVFPMIPVTVSFFTKRSGNRANAIRNASLYGFFIFLIYILISVPFHLLGLKPEILNTISTNAWLNIVFFVIFIIFSLSFFGFFEITLPSSIAGKADSRSSMASAGGIFFMALTLAIVSFSCTGPILGSLLVGSLSGGAWPLTYGLAGFGLALALPFALFAVFPNWLHSLPKSGGWLDTVKKVLAFVELALAFKFLSNADLVMHWGILKREIFFGVWILVGLGLTLYLFGVLRLPHDYKGMKISNGRKMIGVLTLIFTLYLVPGVTSSKYANLKLLSGFPPPLTYSVYGKDNVLNKGLEANVVNDFDKALQLSREQNKPILIDFTGWACVNCRKMEENVWTQPEVYNYIRDNYILVSLYVDDRQLLPIEQRFTYKTSTGYDKEIKTQGDKWATFQEENFTKASQPLYAILDNNERLMNHPVGYTPDAKEYLKWLQCGKQTFSASR
jgi:thiol:disulfide interchange protein